jgi:O-antigen/teichoic acid export membrane protein
LRRLRQIRTLLLYIAIPALSAVTPLVVLPALTSAHGASGLAATGIGQSLGASAAVIAELGWSVLGPQMIAKADPARRRALYQSAFATRLTALAIMMPLSVVAAYSLAAEEKMASAMLAFAFSLAALSPSWYLIGSNRPLLILSVEAVPRLVLSAAAAVALSWGAPLAVYGFLLAVAAVLTWLLAARVAQQRLWPRLSDFRDGRRVIARQLPLTGGRMISVLYTSLPVSIVAVVAPNSTATYAAIDRLTRMGSALLGSVPTRLQSWVGSDPKSGGMTRSRKSLMMNSALGLVAGIGFTIVAPFVATYVFSGVVELDLRITALGGALICAICTSRGLGLSLVAEGKANWISLANLGAAVTGVTCVYLLAGTWGAEGALVGGIAAEVVGVASQLVILLLGNRWIRRRELE